MSMERKKKPSKMKMWFNALQLFLVKFSVIKYFTFKLNLMKAMN